MFSLDGIFIVDGSGFDRSVIVNLVEQVGKGDASNFVEPVDAELYSFLFVLEY